MYHDLLSVSRLSLAHWYFYSAECASDCNAHQSQSQINPGTRVAPSPSSSLGTCLLRDTVVLVVGSIS